MGQQPSSEPGPLERSLPPASRPTHEAEQRSGLHGEIGKEEESQAAMSQSLPVYANRGGITVVNTRPDASWKTAKPVELQKLENIHRFWPILKSSLESIPPQEKINGGVHYREIMSLCIRYQEHLAEMAKVVSTEERVLASRLKDIEMFSAGIMQQLIRRQENLLRANAHLQKVSEVENALVNIKTILDSCIPLVNRFNSYLPEDKRLERFKLHPEESESDYDEQGLDETPQPPTT